MKLIINKVSRIYRTWVVCKFAGAVHFVLRPASIVLATIFSCMNATPISYDAPILLDVFTLCKSKTPKYMYIIDDYL